MRGLRPLADANTGFCRASSVPIRGSGRIPEATATGDPRTSATSHRAWPAMRWSEVSSLLVSGLLAGKATASATTASSPPPRLALREYLDGRLRDSQESRRPRTLARSTRESRLASGVACRQRGAQGVVGHFGGAFVGRTTRGFGAGAQSKGEGEALTKAEVDGRDLLAQAVVHRGTRRRPGALLGHPRARRSGVGTSMLNFACSVMGASYARWRGRAGMNPPVPRSARLARGPSASSPSCVGAGVVRSFVWLAAVALAACRPIERLPPPPPAAHVDASPPQPSSIAWSCDPGGAEAHEPTRRVLWTGERATGFSTIARGDEVSIVVRTQHGRRRATQRLVLRGGEVVERHELDPDLVGPIFGDFDGDGRTDAASVDARELRILLDVVGDAAPLPSRSLTSGRWSLQTIARDLNGDARDELTIAWTSRNIAGIEVWSLRGRWMERLDLQTTRWIPFDLDIADLDGDGIDDLFVTATRRVVAPGQESLSIDGPPIGHQSSPGALGLARGRGDGSFAPLVFHPLDRPISAASQAVALDGVGPAVIVPGSATEPLIARVDGDALVVEALEGCSRMFSFTALELDGASGSELLVRVTGAQGDAWEAWSWAAPGRLQRWRHAPLTAREAFAGGLRPIDLDADGTDEVLMLVPHFEARQSALVVLDW